MEVRGIVNGGQITVLGSFFMSQTGEMKNGASTSSEATLTVGSSTTPVPVVSINGTFGVVKSVFVHAGNMDIGTTGKVSVSGGSQESGLGAGINYLGQYAGGASHAGFGSPGYSTNTVSLSGRTYGSYNYPNQPGSKGARPAGSQVDSMLLMRFFH